MHSSPFSKSSPQKAQLNVGGPLVGGGVGDSVVPTSATQNIVGGEGQRKNLPAAEWGTENRLDPGSHGALKGHCYRAGGRLSHEPRHVQRSGCPGGAAGRLRKPHLPSPR